MAGLTDSYRYSAFGEQIASTGATPNPFGYVGNRAEPAAGLSDFRARAYDPAVGRFTSEDPIKGFATMPQTTNPYAYGVNGPLAHTDADGRFAVGIPLLVVAAPVIVGGAVGCAISEVDCTGAIYDTIAPVPAAAPTPAPTAPGPALAPELGPAPGEEVLPSPESGMGAEQKLPPASAATSSETNGGNEDYIARGELDWSIVSAKGETRYAHVRLHNLDNLAKAAHGVFFDDGIRVTEEAWKIAVSKGIKGVHKGGVVEYTIPMGRQVGYLGGVAGSRAAVQLNSVKIIVRAGSNKVITAFPDL